MDLNEAAAELFRLSRSLDGTLSLLKEQVRAYAQAEADYRQGKAAEWVKLAGDSLLAKEKESKVDAATALLRRDRDIAEGMKAACMEAVRSRRAQISAIQSLLAAYRSEAEFARTGPQYTP